MLFLILSQTVLVTQVSSLSQSSPVTQLDGAKSPSNDLRILPTVISLGCLDNKYPP